MEKLSPFFSVRPWAGTYIAEHFKLAQKNVGEAWLVSTLPEGESTVNGEPLSRVLGKQLSYLVKIIDTKEPLSVQVHPDDQWAKTFENSRGKTECWLILSASPGAGIYLGTKPGVGEKELRSAIEKNDRVNELLHFYPVRPGDFIYVPAGTIHAIGPGITLIEVQQSSGITYRLWDWNRQGRELHLERGLKVADFHSRPGILFNLQDNPAPRELVKHPDFEAHFNQSKGEGWFIDLKTFEAQSDVATNATSFVFVR